MKLPNFEVAHVPTEKLTSYLLNTEHVEGGPKARLLMRFGFSPDDPEELRVALLAHCATHEIASVEQFQYGTKYKILGALDSPDGRNPIVLVVWNIVNDDTIPRLVTVVPQKDRARR